jgi:hypothetical protein
MASVTQVMVTGVVAHPAELHARQIGGCFAFGVGLVARYTLQTRAAPEIHPVSPQQRLARRQSVKRKECL